MLPFQHKKYQHAEILRDTNLHNRSKNAKDFDDAISFRKVKEDLYEIGIHIADVSHYVQQGSEMDKEAYKRATSIYLVDRVVPMLPEKLSNQICSLRPKEEKLCFSAVFEMSTSRGNDIKWFGKTLFYQMLVLLMKKHNTS
ncbi:MAG: hypothetical protein CM15mP83_1670 [Flavobacteriaceae bacterium]|nr:MAG: hypothetical protein CM15mP83_1670 [Flavobacteriaceae bacterium]